MLEGCREGLLGRTVFELFVAGTVCGVTGCTEALSLGEAGVESVLTLRL